MKSVYLLLILTRFHTWFCRFHCWLWTIKYRLGNQYKKNWNYENKTHVISRWPVSMLSRNKNHTMNLANDIKNVKHLFQIIRTIQEGKGTKCPSYLIHLLAFIGNLPDACVGYHQQLKNIYSDPLIFNF